QTCALPICLLCPAAAMSAPSISPTVVTGTPASARPSDQPFIVQGRQAKTPSAPLLFLFPEFPMKPVSMRTLALAAALVGFAAPALAGELSPQAQQQITSTVDRNQAALDSAALEIWKFAELGYQETQSSALLQGQLRDAGFTVTPGIANEPTAFLASFKTGEGPVIAVLAEYDALPGLSQTLSPVQESAGGHAGHGCGHNLFGAASVHAAIAVKAWMEANNIKG